MVNINYRAEIDGLRALAVLPVIFFHAGFEWFSGGFVGVDVFFVISGYLITTIIISEIAEGKFSIVNFYERRARRILPALFFVMLVCLPFAWFWLKPGDLINFGQSLIAVSIFSSNILFWLEGGYFANAAELNPLLHTWSLAVEEQYYILFPVFLLFTWRLGIKWVLTLLAIVFVISLGVAHWGAFNKPSPNFYLLPTRGWELLLGVFAAFYLKYNSYFKSHNINQTLSLIGFGMIFYSIFAFDETTPFPSLYALVPTVGTGLLILSAVPNTVVHKLLSFSPIVNVGLISYSAYLWHLPMLVFARHRLPGELSDLLMIILCAASMIIAWFSWRYIEKPFRDKKRTTRNFIFIFSLLGILGFSTIGLYLYKSINILDDWTLDVRQHHCLLQGDSETVHSESCFENNEGYLLWGDSNAASLSIGLRDFFKKNSISFTQLTQSGCPPIFDLTELIHRKSCNDVNIKVLNKINEKGYKRVILHAAWFHQHYPLSQSEFKEKFEKTIIRLKEVSEIELTVIGNSPRWSDSPYQIDKYGEESVVRGSILFHKPLEVWDIDSVMRALSDKHGFLYVSLIDEVCMNSNDQLYCPLGVSDKYFYRDWGHLSRVGSNYFVSKFSYIFNLE